MNHKLKYTSEGIEYYTDNYGDNYIKYNIPITRFEAGKEVVVGWKHERWYFEFSPKGYIMIQNIEKFD